MNRYNYKDSIEYKKYSIKELLKIKKYNLINKIKYTLNILKDLYNFKSDIQEYYELDIKLSDYMPNFYSNIIFNYLEHDQNKFMNMNINMLNNILYYINKTINMINKKIEDLYYTLI